MLSPLRLLLSEHLSQIDTLEAAIGRVSQEMARRFSLPDPPADQTRPPEEPEQPTLPSVSEENARQSPCPISTHCQPPGWEACGDCSGS